MREGTPLEQQYAEYKAFWIKVNLAALGLLCAANIFGLLVFVPKFMQIYAEMMPGLTLPEVTEFIIHERMPLVLFSMALPMPALVMFWRRRSYANVWINVGISLLIVLGCIEVFALFVPISSGIITSTPDAPLKPSP
jgi:hypothetical protein